jgi:hypothetical protein
MAAHVEVVANDDQPRALAAHLGSWTGVLTALLTIISFTIAIITPPRSGPFCTGVCSVYPYGDTAVFFPRDYLWIFPSMLISPLFLILCACAHSWVAPGKFLFSRLALLFAAISATLITLDYFIQIVVIQPSLLKAETDGLALFSQYNPHGMFIAIEDLGYLMMSSAFFFLGMALSPDSRVECALRRLLIASAWIGLASFFGMFLVFGVNLETRFELAIVTLTWTTLTVASILLAVLMRRTIRATKRSPAQPVI